MPVIIFLMRLYLFYLNNYMYITIEKFTCVPPKIPCTSAMHTAYGMRNATLVCHCLRSSSDLRRIFFLIAWYDFWKILHLVRGLSDSGHIIHYERKGNFYAPRRAGQWKWLEVVKSEIENLGNPLESSYLILSLCFTRWTYKFALQRYVGLVSSTKGTDE